MQHHYKGLVIEVLDDPTYTYGSSDNNFEYSKVYGGEEKFATSKHGIKIMREDELIDSCIIIGSGGATGVSPGSSLIDEDQLLICCCDTIFCLGLPELLLRWKTVADMATCFRIFKLQDDYIVHGELQISRLDRNGKILWQFGGADVFVSIDDEADAFVLEGDHIMLTDFYKIKYKLGFDGQLIWDTHEKKQLPESGREVRTWIRKLFGN